MKTTKRTFLAIIAILGIMGGFTACNNNDNPTDNGNGTDPTPPTVSITNNNQSVTLAPELEITLNGTATKGTNEIKSYEWTVKTTESGVTPVFTSGATAVTKVTGIKKAGTYVFELKVKDTAGLEGKAEATVAVNGYPATKTVTVTFPAFVPNSASFNVTPTYTPTDGWGDFSASDITFTISDNKGHSSATGDFGGNTITASLYSHDDLVTFTQTFTQGENVKSSSFVGWVMNMSGLKFVGLVNTELDEDLGTTIPPVTLTLTKTITEILPPEEE